jgi:hypothetical protein
MSEKVQEDQGTPSPVLYAAVPKNHLVFKNMPPKLKAATDTKRCGHCRGDVLVMRDSYQKTLSIAKKAGRQVLIVCKRCEKDVMQRLLDSGSFFLGTLSLVDPEVRKELNRHYSEIN